jgi:hypothetical protein
VTDRIPAGVGDLDAYWRELVTAALLGTDRRAPPEVPPGAVADLVADAQCLDDAARLLTGVAAMAAVRRAAFVPHPPATPLQPPDQDDRPWCPAAAVSTWRLLVREWPVLEDEWVLTVVERGWRLPPDALVELLQRHRSDAVRRARVALAGGAAARWVVEHVPSLRATTRSTAPAEAVASVPHLPVPPELSELLTADAHTCSRRLGADLASGAYGRAHRAVLVNVLARCRPEVLLDAADAMESTGVGLALALADLARLRHRMLAEL